MHLPGPLQFKQNTIIFTLMVLVFSTLCFIVFEDYFSLDEPNILWEIKKETFWTNYYPRFISEGRSIYGALQWLGIKTTGSLAGLKYLRIISLLFTVLFSLQVFRFLNKNMLSKNLSILIAGLLVTIPGFSSFICWSEEFPHHITSILSFFAGSLAAKAFQKQLGKEELPGLLANLYIFLAIAIQVFALFIYQNMALVFMFPALIVVVISQGQPAKSRLRFFVYLSLIFFISLGIYYKFFQSMLQTNHLEQVGRAKISFQGYEGKLLWFWGILKESAKLQLLLIKSPFLSNIPAFGLVVLLLRDVYKKRFLDLFFLLCSTILFFLPHLLIAESWGACRNFALIELALLFYIIYRVDELIKGGFSLKIVFVVMVLFFSMASFNIYEGWVKPMSKDYKYLGSFVKKLPPLQTDSLYVYYRLAPIDFHEHNSLLKQYADEFNAPIFYRDWPIQPAIKCLYQQMHPEIEISKIDKYIKVRLEKEELMSTSGVLPNRYFIDFGKNWE